MEDIKNVVLKYLPFLAGALMIAVVGILLAILSVRIIRKAMTRKNADPSLISFVCKAVRIMIYVITLIAAMSSMQISTAGLIAFFSAAAAAIALALKDRLNDIASGIVILFTKPFVTGDFIEFGKFQGFVQKIDIMHTNILTYDGTNVIVPNSVISGSEVNNYTAHPEVRVTINVPIPYDADIDKVKTVLMSVVDKTEHIIRDDSHRAFIRLEGFGDSSLDFTVRCFCEYKDYWTVYYALTEGIKKALDRENITIPFNQMDVHIIDQP